MSIADIPQLQKLSTPEKLRIIGELWDSIGRGEKEFPLTAEQQAVLDARLAEDDAHPAKALTVEEFRAELARRV